MRSDPQKQQQIDMSGEAAADVRVVAKGGGVQTLGQITQAVAGFLFNAVAVRFLGSAGFGLYKQTFQVLRIAGQIGTAGFNVGSTRYMTRARARGDHGSMRGALRVTLGGTLITSSLTALALVIGADLLASAFAEGAGEGDYLAFLFRVGAAYVPLFALMETLRFSTQAYKTMVPSVIVGNITQPTTRFVLGVAALSAGLAVTGATASLAVSAGIGALAGAWYVRRMLAETESVAKPAASPWPIVRFSLLQSGSTLLSFQRIGLGVIVLGILGTNTEVGLFAIALALQGPANVFLNSIGGIWAPVVTDLYERREIGRLASLYQTVNRWVATFSFPVLAVLIVDPDLPVRLFAGKSGAGAAPLVAILAVGNIFYTGTGPSGFVISMTGRPGINLVLSLLSVAAYVGLGIAFVPQYGALALAIIDAGVTISSNLVRVLAAWLIVRAQPFGKTFLKPVAGASVAALTMMGWSGLGITGFLADLAGLVLVAGAYLLVLWFLGVDPQERHVYESIRNRVPFLKGR